MTANTDNTHHQIAAKKRQPSKLKKILSWLILIVLILFICALIAVGLLLYFLPGIVQKVAVDQYPKYVEQGSLAIGNLDIDLFNGNLVLHDVELKKQQQQVLSLGKLAVTANLYQLKNGNLEITNAAIDELGFAVKRNNFETTVAGFELDGKAEKKAANSSENKAAPSFIKSISIDKINLTNSKIDYSDKQLKSSINIGSLQLAQLTAKNLNDIPKLAVDKISLNKSNISLDDQQTNAKLKIGQLQVFKLASNNQNAKSSVAIDKAQLQNSNISYNNQDITSSIDINSLEVFGFDSANLDAKLTSKAELTVAKLNANYNQKTLAIAPAAKLNLSLSAFDLGSRYPQAQAQFTLNDLVLLDGKRQLLALKKLQTDNLKAEKETISIDKIAFEELYLLDKSQALGAANINKIALNKFADLSIATVDAQQLALNISLDKNKKLNIVQQLQPYLPAKDNSAASGQNSSQFNAKIDHILLQQNSRLNYSDLSVGDGFSSKINLKKLELKNIDTASANNSSQIELIAALSKHNQINFNGKFNLFAPKISGKGKLRATEMELLPFSPYVIDAVGYQVRTGNANLALDFEIVNEELDGELKMKLFALSLQASGDKKADNLQQLTTVPLDMALDLLRNKNDDMDIKLKLAGNINEPQFNIDNILTQATTQILKKATLMSLKQMFFPYGTLISVGSWVGDKLTAVRLDPLLFATGSLSIQAKDQQYLDKVGEIMQQQTKIRIKLCPVLSPLEQQQINAQPAAYPQLLTWLAAANKTSDKTSDNAAEQPAFELDAKAMLKIGEQRAHLVKQYLIEKQKIASNRLLNCQPLFSRDQQQQQSILSLEI